MNIVIRNYLAGSFLLEQEPHLWDAIIILDSGMSPTGFVAQHTQSHLYLRFDDVFSLASNEQAPTTLDIQSSVAFAEQSQNLMVCCRAGQSRSAATAFVIAHKLMGSEAARGLLNAERHIPNPLIIQLGAQITNDPLMLETFAKWQEANSHVKLADHMEEIDRELDELESQGARNRIIKG